MGGYQGLSGVGEGRWAVEVKLSEEGLAWLKAESRLELARDRLRLALSAVDQFAEALETAREGRDYGAIPPENLVVLEQVSVSLAPMPGMLLDVASALDGVCRSRRPPPASPRGAAPAVG